MKRNTIFVRMPALLLSLILLCTACGDSARATVMRLTRTQGTVKILDEEGENLSPEEDMRLYDGYNLSTRRQSFAWINLDEVKLAKMDAVSGIQIRKSGNDLEITVNEGKLFFHVKEPLGDEESLNIRTSTMSVGIRGTCGWVEVSDLQRMRVYVLEGTVECSVTDQEGGQRKTASVSGGEKAEISAKSGTEINVKTFSEEEIGSFVLEELAEDEELREKIRQNSGLEIRDFPESGTPGSPMDQAAGELDGLLAGIGEEDGLVYDAGDFLNETGRFDWEDTLHSESAGFRLSGEGMTDSMLQGKEEADSPWLEAMKEAFASERQGDSPAGSSTPDYMQIRMARGINCYKPNIYFYGEEGTRFTLTFDAPMLLTQTIPDYGHGWEVEIGRDGKLTVDGKTGYPYLFYESETIPGIYQTEQGFLVKAQDRERRFEEILQLYGLNQQEIQDFIEFWDVMLDQDKDYFMYPQETELVDQAMPITISGGEIENYFRLWFCFQKTEKNYAEPDLPEIKPASHEGTAMVEWGGMILP